MDSYPDLIQPEYRTWFIKRLKILGREEFIERAEKARKYGNNPQKLFVSLVK